MRFFLISDNSDAMNGLRLAGIEGTVARSEADLRHALADAANQPDIAVLLVTEKIAETYTAVLDNARAAGGPLLWQPVWPVSAAAWPLPPQRLLLSLPTARTKRPSVRA